MNSIPRPSRAQATHRSLHDRSMKVLWLTSISILSVFLCHIQCLRLGNVNSLLTVGVSHSSYLILPYGSSTATPMNPSAKKWIKWMRIIQLVLRCFELIAALGLLVLMILIKGVDASTGWVMRIVVSFQPLSLHSNINFFTARSSNSSYSLWNLPPRT